ncbi:hypothetical protein, partial [Nitrospira sp. T9]|uniref:hypothetical protein n=1 Tax=unclassified Nitrospira TaxID=2652172 RepID=UPI003F9E1AD8
MATGICQSGWKQILRFSQDNGMDSPFKDGIECAKLDHHVPSVQRKGGVIMKRTTIGIDIAKNV